MEMEACMGMRLYCKALQDMLQSYCGEISHINYYYS